MSANPFGAAGLGLEQAPPLSIPASFFLVAPVAIAAAGVLLVFGADAPLRSSWAPLNIAAVHLATLGMLGSVMLGALYQMVPVVAGTPVPYVRLAHGVHVGLVLGVSSLVFGFATGNQTALLVAFTLLLVSLLAFWLPTAWALVRAPTRSHTVTGMRVAMLGLAAMASLGLYMTWRRSGPGYSDIWLAVRTAHVGIAFVVWVGGLLTAVSWQVLPMFYLAAEVPPASRRLVLGGITLSLVALPILAFLDPAGTRVAWGALPGALAVWGVHPLTAWRSLSRRKRRRSDPSLAFWRVGLLCAPLALGVGLWAMTHEEPEWNLLFGWLVVWGWAGSIIHGMLCRIVPFLVWFHRFAPLAGQVPTPSMRRMLSPRRQSVALSMHVTALVAGSVAVFTVHPIAGRVFGVALLAAAATLGANLVHVLRFREE